MTSQSFQLVMQKGPNLGKIYELVQEEITIGRDITNRIVINDPEVSRRHARLTSQMGGYVIEDLGSTNGTFVDGQRLMGPHLLRPGQTVMFGEKIALAYETLGFDPNATLVSGAAVQPSPQTAPRGGAADTYRVDAGPAAPAPQAEPSPAYTPPAYSPPPAYTPPAAYPPAAASPSPAYTGQIPAGPSEPVYTDIGPSEPYLEDEDEPRRSRTMLFVGGGLVIVLLCCLVVSAFAFDYLNLYCQEPFSSLSGVLWSCPAP